MWQPAKISQVPGAENQHLGEKSDISKPREAFRITQVSGFLTTTHRKRHTYTLVQCTLFFVCVYRHIHQNKNFTIAITFLLHKKENYFNCDPQFAKCWSSSAPVFQRSTFQSWPRALEPRAA